MGSRHAHLTLIPGISILIARGSKSISSAHLLRWSPRIGVGKDAVLNEGAFLTKWSSEVSNHFR
ncbi:hypothetical protein BSZ35_14655 [Salinibacter sp. 10B]|nr:hypothetical protein BSZ35_14655 [Salinibacter sp. 10B]